MKLFKIMRPSEPCWDEYEGAIVAAENEDQARNTVLSTHDSYMDEWVAPHEVVVTYIGEAAENIEQGVILSSYINC